eukprot:s1496_g12.t1
MSRKGWEKVDIKQSIHEALLATERFGPCFLSWAEIEDKEEMMRLKELRVFRTIHRNPSVVTDLKIVEWTSVERYVKDFEYYQKEGADGPIVVAATIGPDPSGKRVRAFWKFLEQEEFGAAVLEGPRDVAWDVLKSHAVQAGLQVTEIEYLTSELGELLARRRRATFVHRKEVKEAEVEGWLARTVTAPSLGSILKKAKPDHYVPCKHYERAVGQGNHAMLPLVGAHVWFESEQDRVVVYRLSGPGRWPLTTSSGEIEELYVVDKATPQGMVRQITAEELWLAQGRGAEEWRELSGEVGAVQALRHGCMGTGRRTALSLLSVLAGLAVKEENEGKVGMCVDFEDYKSLGQLLLWLRRWRQGEFARAAPDRRAGGQSWRQVWFWGEELWLEALDAAGSEEENDRYAAGKRELRSGKQREAEKFVQLQPEIVGDLNIQAQIEEWLEEHMDGDKAKSTKRAYQSAWEKWTDWAKRQGWLSPFLNAKDDPVINENKLLGYLG